MTFRNLAITHEENHRAIMSSSMDKTTPRQFKLLALTDIEKYKDEDDMVVL